ncbi:MAG: glycosyltransferase [Actinomycetaceae bacterium]|nr:glycosyltransferase [Actinomycetaceae bacterium]
MYSAATRVVHINEVANVPSTLVAHARQEGKAWSLRRIPVGRGNPAKVILTRLQDLAKWLKERRQVDIVHLHYAANGYYGWGKQPFVLHLHGSDVRKDWQKPGLRQVISKSLRRADAVICATPDLLAWVQSVRPDAQWLPNPLPAEFFAVPEVSVVPGRVIFSSRWDDTKGLDLLLPLAQQLVQAGFEVHGLDWGTHAQQARELGVVLHPLMDLHQFAQFLGSASLVVGQLKYATMTMTDYQTLALGRPLLVGQSIEQAPVKQVQIQDVDFPEDANKPLPRDVDAIAKWVVDFLATGDTDAASQERRDWVLANHHPAQVVARLEEIYQSLV